MKKHRSELGSRCKVRQMGIGYKTSKRKMKKDSLCMVIFVTKKFSAKSLRQQLIKPVPKKIDDIMTDIVEIPAGFRPRAADDSRYRPFSGGVAIINYRTPATGTLGLIVRRRTTKSFLYGLTNNHVGANEDIKGLSPPAARIGDYWTQPGAHGNGKVFKDVVARLLKWNRIKPSAPGQVNYYDVAIGRITRPSKPDAISYEVMEIGPVKGMEDIEIGDKVMKRGRTTRKTLGTVAALIPSPMSISIEYNGFPSDFTDLAVIVGDPVSKPFSLPGDSGSVVVSANKNLASGAHKVKALLFAGGAGTDGIDRTIVSPIKRIARDFKLII